MSRLVIFSAADFGDVSLHGAMSAAESRGIGLSNFIHPVDAAQKANEKLAKLVEDWPVVTGIFATNSIFGSGENSSENDTHIARLAFIELIEKKECEHLPKLWQWDLNDESMYAKCRKCGRKLKAKWGLSDLDNGTGYNRARYTE